MELANVPIEDIEVKERAREDVGDTTDIEESAKSYMGQIQTIAVIKSSGGPKPYILLAGERRLRAFQKIGETTVGVRIYPADLTELQKRSIELVENTARLDFDWKEQVKLTQQIHELQKDIAEDKGESWSLQKTADTLERGKASIFRDLELAQAIETIPELENAKTKREAENALAKMVEAMVLKEKASRIEEARQDTPLDDFRAELRDSYVLMDALEGLNQTVEGYFDMVELDPDYAIEFGDAHNANSSQLIANLLKGDYSEVSKDVGDYSLFLRGLFNQAYDKLKDDGWLLVWYAQEPWAEVVFRELCGAGFQCKRIPLVWNKNCGADARTTAAPDIYLGRTYECCYYARKGKPRINKRARADVFTYPTPKKRIHPTEKPLALMEDIYETFLTPGAKILIPFLGSGNGIFAAANLGMEAQGFDLGESFKAGFDLRTQEWEFPDA